MKKYFYIIFNRNKGGLNDIIFIILLKIYVNTFNLVLSLKK